MHVYAVPAFDSSQASTALQRKQGDPFGRQSPHNLYTLQPSPVLVNRAQLHTAAQRLLALNESENSCTFCRQWISSRRSLINSGSFCLMSCRHESKYVTTQALFSDFKFCRPIVWRGHHRVPIMHHTGSSLSYPHDQKLENLEQSGGMERTRDTEGMCLKQGRHSS
jgi:hypothetical protein